MFKIERNPTFWWPVTLQEPDPEKPGEMKDAGAIEVQFRWLNEPDLEAWSEKNVTERRSDRQAMQEIVLGYRGVADANGTELSFTPENLQRLLAEPLMATRLARAFYESRNKAAQKN